ncbi:hypothetical protein [Nocardia terpenica]|uniref:Uncharacterized protein n=1 Tax=Nocardia terpenica TaxID=455432 RepID=A0A6G9Z2I5_9NOCA|nr:hypothetical protein [Nocardia terpenica]QIS19577.1 hypothetical protein F6W96_16075 [Nocardia terpenica]
MSDPDRILHLINAAVATHRIGGQAALEEFLSQLNDDDLQTLIFHFPHNIGANVRLNTPEDGWREGRPQ